MSPTQNLSNNNDNGNRHSQKLVMKPAELQWVNCEPTNPALRIQPHEIEAICNFLPVGQNLIHFAIRCSTRVNRQELKECVVILTNYFVLCIGNKTPNVEGSEVTRLCLLHIDDIDLIGYSRDKEVLVRTRPVNLRLMEDGRHSNMRFAQYLYRNYQMIYAAYDKYSMKLELRADNMKDFPDINVYVSPSQKFQFLYHALCTKCNASFHQEVVRFIHSMVLYGGSIVDLSQFPLDDYGVTTDGYDLRPIFRALALQKYVCGVCCHFTERPNIMDEIQCLLEESHKLQIIHISNCGVTSGLEGLLEASKKKSGLPIRYWNLSGNKFTDFKAFITLLECTKNPLYYLDISDCGLTTEDTRSLFKVLAENKNLHEIQQLHLGGCPMDDDAFSAFTNYLKVLKKREETEPSFRVPLHSLNIGLLSEGVDRYMDILTTFESPLRSLILSASTLNQQAADKLIGYLRGASALRVLDLSGTKISAESVADIVSAIGENKDLHHFDLRLNYLYLTSGNLLPIFRVFLSGNLNRWRALSFNGNNMNQDDLRNIIPLLKMMKHLRSLSLSDNFNDTMPNIEDILPKLLEIPSLNRLCLAGGEQKLKEKIIPLISKLREHPNIREVDVSCNSMGDAGIAALINYMRSFKEITELKIDGSDFKSIDLLASLISVVGDGKHKSLITMDFPLRDAQSFLKTLSGAAQKDAVGRLANLQCRLVNTISEHRAFQGKPGRLPFDASPEITALIADISRKYRDEFLENEDPLTHTYFCDEIGLPLPYQKMGDLVGDGGETRRIKGFPELSVYDTDSLYLQIIEDRSHYIAPSQLTASSHFGTSSHLMTEEASLLTGTFNRETVEQFHKKHKHHRHRSSSKRQSKKIQERGKVIMSDDDSSDEKRKSGRRGSKRGVEFELPQSKKQSKAERDSSDDERDRKRSSHRKKEESRSTRSSSKKVVVSSDSSEEQEKRSSKRLHTREELSSNSSDEEVRHSKKRSVRGSGSDKKTSSKKASSAQLKRAPISESSDEEPRAMKQRANTARDEGSRRSKRYSSGSSDESPKKKASRKKLLSSDSDEMKPRMSKRAMNSSDEGFQKSSRKHKDPSEDFARKSSKKKFLDSSEEEALPKRKQPSSDSDNEVRRSSNKRKSGNFSLRSRDLTGDSPPAKKKARKYTYSSSDEWEPQKRRKFISSDDDAPPKKSSKHQSSKKWRESSESSDRSPPQKKQSKRRVQESDSSDSAERLIMGLTKKDQRRRNSSSDELPIKKKPIPKPWKDSD